MEHSPLGRINQERYRAEQDSRIQRNELKKGSCIRRLMLPRSIIEHIGPYAADHFIAVTSILDGEDCVFRAQQLSKYAQPLRRPIEATHSLNPDGFLCEATDQNTPLGYLIEMPNGMQEDMDRIAANVAWSHTGLNLGRLSIRS